MSEDINANRHRLLGGAGFLLAAAQLGLAGCANASSDATKSGDLAALTPGANSSFGTLKQIDAGLLNVGYAEVGPTMVPRLSCCTAGPTISTASSTSRRSWRPRATG